LLIGAESWTFGQTLTKARNKELKVFFWSNYPIKTRNKVN